MPSRLVDLSQRIGVESGGTHWVVGVENHRSPGASEQSRLEGQEEPLDRRALL